MSKTLLPIPADFSKLLNEVKTRIQEAQTRAVLSANTELVRLYWDIGRMIDRRQRREGWGAAVIPRLARELRNELPEIKGFSERNIKSMLAFYREYPHPVDLLPQAAASLSPSAVSPPTVAKSAIKSKVQQPVAQLSNAEKVPPIVAQLGLFDKVQQPVAQLPSTLLWLIPWGHHILLMLKVKDPPTRLWYMQETLANGWSRNVLLMMIQSEAHKRQGKAITNFELRLPPPQSDLARQTLKDPYIFDFLTLEEPFHERELETNLLHHLERFLIELGRGFAFVGRQVHMDVGEEDFYVDLLFYHLTLRAFVVIDLKKGAFKPEYAGKMNFYLSVVDDKLRHQSDAPSIGLILCQNRNRIIAEYALRGVNKPIGVSQYELTRALPSNLKSALPTVEQIEAELAESDKTGNVSPKKKKTKSAKPSKSKTKKKSNKRPKKGSKRV